jgi:hypothetical protein
MFAETEYGERLKVSSSALPSFVATLWQHSDRPIRPIRPRTAQNGRCGRRRTHMARANKVEGLVGRFPRGGSSPLGRIETALEITEASGESLAERMRAFTGEWIAIKDDEILHASNTPQALVRWLGNHGQKADSVFRVPEDERASLVLRTMDTSIRAPRLTGLFDQFHVTVAAYEEWFTLTAANN